MDPFLTLAALVFMGALTLAWFLLMTHRRR